MKVFLYEVSLDSFAFLSLNDGGIGKYLGLPEHFSRKKRDIFASLVDRIAGPPDSCPVLRN